MNPRTSKKKKKRQGKHKVRHLIIKMLKIKYKEKNLESGKRGRNPH